MNRSTLVAILLTVIAHVGVAIALLSTDGHEEDPPYILPFPAAPEGKPLDSTPAQNQDLEVFFINAWNCIPLPLDTPTVIDRGDLLVRGDDMTSTNGSGGWETKVLRTTTHLTITTVSDIGHYRKVEYSVPLSDLPMDFPHDKIQTMVDGRFEVTKDGQSSGPAGSGIEVLFAGHEVLYAGRELIEIPYGRRTLINTGPLTLTNPQPASGWETAIRRTGTHAIIVHVLTIDGQSTVTEYPVPIADLPLELPSKNIPVRVRGRLYATTKR